MYRYDIKWGKPDVINQKLIGKLFYRGENQMVPAFEIADIDVSSGNTGICRVGYEETSDILITEDDSEKIMQMMTHYWQGFFSKDVSWLWVMDPVQNEIYDEDPDDDPCWDCDWFEDCK